MPSIPKLLPALLLSLSLGSGCAAMAAAYNSSLDAAVTVSAVDQQAYTRVAIDTFACSENGYACDPQVGQLGADKLAMTLGRLGYEVFDSAQFHAWVVQPPTIVVAQPAGHVGASVSVGPDGVAISANDGYGEVSVSAGMHGGAVAVGGPAEVIYYESLPVESRQVIMERSGIRGVVTGRIHVSPPNDTTLWKELHVMIRLGDAATGALIWQGEWKESVDEDESVAQVLGEAMDHLDRALQRKAPLQNQAMAPAPAPAPAA